MGDTVYVNGRSALHKGSGGRSMAAFPDVCLCPPAPPAGPIPTPLPNNALVSDLEDGEPSVLIDENPAGTKKSYLSKSTGNEVAKQTGGGVVSHAVQGAAYFASYSFDVKFGGEPAVRHLDVVTHNHQNPGNTPPWPVLASMSVAVVNACSESGEHCQLVPYGEKSCPEGQTPHHVIPTSCFIKSGMRELNEAMNKYDGRLITKADIRGTCIKGARNYRSNDAPCICVTGRSKDDRGPDGKLENHGRIHRRFDLAEAEAAEEGGWSYREAQKAGARVRCRRGSRMH